MRYLQILLSFVFFSPVVLSQKLENPVGALKQERQFIFGLDNRRTHLQGKMTLIYGGFIGFSFGDKLRLKASVSGNPFEAGRTRQHTIEDTFSRLLFVSIGEEFHYYKYKRFTFSTYAQIGAGFDFYRIVDNNLNETGRNKNVIFPLELGTHTSIRTYDWLFVKLGGGWRFVLPDYNQQLGGYYLKIGLVADSRQLYKMFKHRKQSSSD